MSRFDVSALLPLGPGLWACADAGPCSRRQDAQGPQREFAAGELAPGTSPGAISSFERAERARLAAERDARAGVA